jgi:hypothetical protein
MEAKKELYSHNEFSFRAARGVARFHAALSSHNWQLLRHLHISTLFRTPKQFHMNGSLPPENYQHWNTACEALRTLRKLHSLKIEMVIWNHDRGHDSKPVHHDSLVFIFGALMELKAHSFVVELNMELPVSIRTALGDLPFTITVQERSYDWNTFC